MSEAAQGDQPTPTTGPAPATLNLRILSPSADFPQGGWDIKDVPASTPIAELKRRISNVLPTHPPPDRQRIIYQGRLLSQEAQTLAEVFGQQVNQQRDFSLHLVLRPTGGSTPTSSAPASRSATPLPGLPPRPASHGPTPGAHHPHPNLFPPGVAQRPPGFPQAFPMPPFPIPGIPQGLPIPGQQVHVHHVHPPTQPNGMPLRNGSPGTPSASSPHPQVPQGVPTPTAFQQIIARQQQARAAAGQQGIGTGSGQPPQRDGNTEVNGADGVNQQAQGNGIPPQTQQAGQQQPGATVGQQPGAATGAREVTGPNGMRYSVTVNQSTFTFPNAPGQPLPGFPNAFPQPFGFTGLPHPGFHHPHHPPQMPFQRRPTPAPMLDAGLLGEIGDFARQFAEREGVTNEERERLNNLLARTNEAAGNALANNIQQHPLANSIPGLNQQAGHQPPTNMLNRILSPQLSQQPTAPSQSFDSTQPTVYLLSSPTGPHALLFTPQGVYNGSFPSTSSRTTLPGISPTPTPTTGIRVQPQTGAAYAAEPAHAPQGLPQPPGQQAGQAQLAQLPQQPQPANGQQPAPQAQEQQLLPQLLPQFWLLFRILIFAYFFLGSGQGWRRPLVLLVIGVAFWAIRGGLVGQGVEGAIRGWWEGVVGVPNRARQQGAQQGQGQQQGAQPGGQGQQAQQELPWWRERLRPAERAAALFVASLWPGIGERAIQARREEEQARLRREQEAREADERRVVETQAQQNQSQGQNQAVEGQGGEAVVTAGSETQEAEASGAEFFEETGVRERKRVSAQAQADHAGPSVEAVQRVGEGSEGSGGHTHAE